MEVDPQFKTSPEQREKSRTWGSRHRPQMREISRRYRDALKAEMIAAYGGSCRCCNAIEPAFLTLDHINGDGAQDRKATGHSGTRIFLRAGRKAEPNKYQLLCWNCQWGKRLGGCPHKRVM